MNDFYEFAPRTEDEYLTTRVVDQIKWYDKKSIENKKCFLRLRVVEIIIALFIPFLTAYITDSDSVLKIIVGLMGITIGVVGGLITLMKFQENWVEHRNVAEFLKYEKFLFLSKSGPYRNLGNDAFPIFVENVEKIIFCSTEKWINSKREEQVRQNTESNNM